MTEDGGAQPGMRWEPANDVERRLLAAAQAGHEAAMVGILMGAPLFLPGFAGEPGGGQRLLTRELRGVPYLLAFTSVEALRQGVESDGWRPTSLPELVRAWRDVADERWGLAVNPLTPVEVLVDPETVPALLPAESTLASFEPANETERLLRDALAVPDGQLVLEVLVSSRVVVPTTAMEVDGSLAVPAFTSPQRCTEFLGAVAVESELVELDMVALLQQWPGEEYRLAVNPGSPIELWLDGDRLGALLAYAARLAEQLRDGPSTGEGPSIR